MRIKLSHHTGTRQSLPTKATKHPQEQGKGIAGELQRPIQKASGKAAANSLQRALQSDGFDDPRIPPQQRGPLFPKLPLTHRTLRGAATPSFDVEPLTPQNEG